MGIIYLAKNKINNKVYVGQTIRDLELRKKVHVRSALQGSDYLFHRALRKYGSDNFEWSVLEESLNENLNDLEKKYIKYYQSYAAESKTGYNMTIGGDNNYGSKGDIHWLNRLSEEEKELWILENRSGKNNPNYGNHKLAGDNHFLNKMSEEEREKWKDTYLRGKNNYQKKMTKQQLIDKNWYNNISREEQIKWAKEKMSGENNPFKNAYNKDPEKYKKLWAANSGENSKSSKEFIFTNVATKEEIYCKSAKRFSEFLSKKCSKIVCPSSFTSRARKKSNKPYKGFLCRFYVESIDGPISKFLSINAFIT